MKRVARKATTLRGARAWELEQYRKMTPDERPGAAWAKMGEEPCPCAARG